MAALLCLFVGGSSKNYVKEVPSKNYVKEVPRK